jgi:hypothetical protein
MGRGRKWLEINTRTINKTETALLIVGSNTGLSVPTL